MPSGLLRDVNVRFYHPVDDLTEYTRSLDWTNIGDNSEFVPSILTSGVKTVSGISVGQIAYTPGTPYTSLYDADSFVCAFWASGFLASDDEERYVHIGMGTNIPVPQSRNAISLEKLAYFPTPTSGFRINIQVNNAWKVANWTPSPANDTDWHLFIIDARYETSGWRHRVSLDGSGWIDLGVDDNTAVTSNHSNPYMTILDHATSPKIILDEVVLWGDNNLFTAQELSNLYELYNTYNTTMDQYISTFGTSINSGIDLFIHGYAQVSGDISLYIPGQKETKSINLFTQGTIQTSGNIDLYISGIPLVASSSIDLYLKVVTPEFLYDENVIFYHPVNNTTEYTKSLDWTNLGDDFDFVSSILTSGIKTTSGDSLAELVYTPGTPYTTLLNASGATCAVWVSGFLGSDGDSRQVDIGFANSSNTFKDGIELFKSTSSSGFQIVSVINGTYKGIAWIPPPSNDSDWHFFIIDIRYETSGWRHRVSLDGSGWIDLGVDDTSNVFFSNPRPFIRTFDHVTSPKIVLDEVVLWGDNDLFTTQELSNLYELYNTYNTTMDQYTSIFGTIVSGGIDCYINGCIQASGNISLYIPGQYETKSINLFIQGIVQTSGNIDLYISGTPSVASSSIDLYLKVATPVDDNINLYTVGPLSISGNIDNFILGYQASYDNIDQYIQGHQPISGNIDLYTIGTIPASSSINLYTVGPILISDSIDDLIIGHLSISGNFSLFIRNGLDIDGFVRVVDNNPSDDIDLFVHGVPSGESTTSYTNNTITLFISNDGESTTIDSNWSAFIEVADATLIPYSGIWQSFIKGGNIANDNINLYINSHASGNIPHGILISGSFTTFINGLSLQGGDEGLLFDEYSIETLETSGFIKIHLGVIDTFDLYISGEIPIVPPSATLNLFTFGILGITSGSHTLYITSKKLINNTHNLFVFGIQDIESGNIPLYLEVTTLGSLNIEGDLYSHGY